MQIQMAYNEEHGITPKTIQKSVRDLISISKKVAREEMQLKKDPESMSKKELEKLIAGCGEKDEESCGGTEFRGGSPAA